MATTIPGRARIAANAAASASRSCARPTSVGGVAFTIADSRAPPRRG
jgi:hypothetical protein